MEPITKPFERRTETHSYVNVDTINDASGSLGVLDAIAAVPVIIDEDIPEVVRCSCFFKNVLIRRHIKPFSKQDFISFFESIGR